MSKQELHLYKVIDHEELNSKCYAEGMSTDNYKRGVIAYSMMAALKCKILQGRITKFRHELVMCSLVPMLLKYLPKGK